MATLFWLYHCIPSVIMSVLTDIGIIDGIGPVFAAMFVRFCLGAWVLPALWVAAGHYQGPKLWAIGAKLVVISSCLVFSVVLLSLVKVAAQG